jgi:hypothetical protein
MAARHNLESFGLRLVDDSDAHATNRVEYKGKALWKLDTRTYAVDVVNQSKNQTIAWAVGLPGAKPPSGQTTTYGPEVEFAGKAQPPKPPTAAEALPPVDEKLNFGVEPLPPPAPSANPPEVSAPTRLPWIVRSQRFWYVASNPFSYAVEGSAYLAFCDALHDMLRSGVKEETHPALVRLEDVHALRDSADLVLAADYLKGKGIPFVFTLVPAYENPATKIHSYLSTSPEFLATVRALVARGGVPILHGYTHQRSGETAVDFEFWDATADQPLSTGTEFAAERVVRGLSECFLAEIYPVAWTTPHYAASQLDYDAVRGYFTTAVERRQPIDRLGSDQFFPYPIYRDMHQQIILPENLGYVQPEAGRNPTAILQDAENGLVVRDGWASFFYHSFLDPNLLKAVVEGLQRQGYKFVDLRDFNNKVRTDDTVAVTGAGEVRLALKGQYLNSFTLDPQGRKEGETFSFRPVTGNIALFASTHEGETQVYQGVRATPPFTMANLGKFRPTVSGLTSPVAIFLLFVGLAILIVFLVIWIFLLTRKAANEFRVALRSRGRG